MAADGVREVTLLGQNVNSYRGVSADGSTAGFAELVYMLAETEGLERIRFMTSHPKDLSEELIEAFGKCAELCGHIHLPVQSGSDRVLSRMNRKYSAADYIRMTEKLRSVRPDIAITTDIIVGFPGETEEDFAETLRLVKQVEFDSAFTFIYSVRRGTPAEKYPDQIPENVKHERFNRLVETVNSIAGEKNRAHTGRSNVFWQTASVKRGAIC